VKRVRSFSAALAALAVASGVAVLPALTSAVPASAQASCAGTTLLPAVSGGQVRVPTTTDGSGHLNCVLGLGNAGEAVARLQIALDYCNLHANLAIDSQYGPLTEAAVKAVEQASSLPQDGVFGQLTSGRMKWPVAGSNNTKCDWWG
jgi:peptidoglycan hydrolase-like protein with peptidoglycan-binding domain